MAAKCVAASTQKTELSYVTLNSAPDMLYFACRPKELTLPTGIMQYDTAAAAYRIQMEKSKGVNMEILGIDMSINTSSNVLNQAQNVQLDRHEMDRCTKESCCSLSGFPYSRLAFRKYRHFALVKMEDLSGIFSTPGAVDGLTI